MSEPTKPKPAEPGPAKPESAKPESAKPGSPNKKDKEGSISYSDFKKVVKDFVTDILKTYPEEKETLDEDLRKIYEDMDPDNKATERVYNYCRKVYPERFFDVLYQNDDIFTDDGVETEFLPKIHFSKLWVENISDNTRQTIWKYLQLVLFTIVSSLSEGESFGDTAKLFEAINQDEFKSKLEETMNKMHEMFDGEDNSSGVGADDLPDPEDLHEHVSGMMDGKLGKLAKEIADETAKDMNLDMDDGNSVKDVFEKLFKHPTKLMSLVKSVGSKLDEKMKAGDIKESELLEEASNLIGKMKNIPGMGNLKEMFGKMGMNGKMDMNAMKNNLQKNMRNAKQRERMREKLYERQLRKESEQMRQQTPANGPSSTGTLHTNGTKDGIESMVFSTGSKAPKSAKQPSTGNKKRRKRKKK